MTATIISNAAPFGVLTNEMVADLYTVNDTLNRLQAAIASASSGYSGTGGTEYEGAANNFGIVPSATPGQKGSDYAFAVGTLYGAWGTFWTSALPAIQAIDNGVVGV